MLVVRRPFKSFGKVYTAGTVITEPAAIKRLKGKIAEGKIIEVTEQTLESTTKYFKDKYGVDLVPDKAVKKPAEPAKTEPVKVAAAKKVAVSK